MKTKPDKVTQVLQRARRERLFREKIKAMASDWLDSGESLEGLAIRVDIAAAGAGLSNAHRDIWRHALEIIRKAREHGVGRNQIIAYLRSLTKTPCEVPQAEQLILGFAERTP